MFPVINRNNYIVKYRKMLEDYKLTYAIYLPSESNWVMKNREPDVNYTTDYNEAIISSETILILPGLGKKYYAEYLKIINLSLSLDRKVIMTKSLYNLFGDLVENEYKIEVIDNEVEKKENVEYKIDRIEKPVVCVMSIGENAGKFEVQLELTKALNQYGYKSFQIGTKPTANIFGMETLPEFLFDEEIGFEKKVYKFNQYLYEKTKNSDDVIIIGVPGGVMPLNNSCYSHFSEVALVITQAVKIDYCILNLYANKYIDKEYIRGLKNLLLEKYKCIVEHFVFSNSQYRYNEEKDEVEYISFGKDEMEDNLPDISMENFQYASITDEVSLKELLENIIFRMQSDIDII